MLTTSYKICKRINENSPQETLNRTKGEIRQFLDLKRDRWRSRRESNERNGINRQEWGGENASSGGSVAITEARRLDW